MTVSQDYEHQGRFSFTSFGALFRKPVKKKRFGPLWHLFQAVLSAMPALCLWVVVEWKERDWKRKYPQLDFSKTIVQISTEKEEDEVATDAESMDAASMITLKEKELEKLYNKGVITKEEYEVNRGHLDTVPLAVPDRLLTIEDEVSRIRMEMSHLQTKKTTVLEDVGQRKK